MVLNAGTTVFSSKTNSTASIKQLMSFYVWLRKMRWATLKLSTYP